jgi:hypothetical protein
MTERISHPEHIEPKSERQILLDEWRHASAMLAEVDQCVLKLSSINPELEQEAISTLESLIDGIPAAELPVDIDVWSPLERADWLKEQIQKITASIEEKLKKLNR